MRNGCESVHWSPLLLNHHFDRRELSTSPILTLGPEHRFLSNFQPDGTRPCAGHSDTGRLASQTCLVQRSRLFLGCLMRTTLRSCLYSH